MLAKLTGSLSTALVVVLALSLALAGTNTDRLVRCEDFWQQVCPTSTGGVEDFCLLCVSLYSPTPAAPIPGSASTLPLQFEPNLGQAESPAPYLTRGEGFTALLQPHQVELSLASASISLLLEGASPAAQAEPLDALGGRVHYLLGPDPSQWITHVPVSRRVRFHNVYPGIDVDYYGTGRDLEHDFLVHPGADPTRIRMSFPNAARVTLNAEGALEIEASGHKVVWKKPVVYQTRRGQRIPVEAAYRLASSQEARFELGPYSPDSTLVIDPVLTYQSYVGRSANDAATRIAVDNQGNLYFTGATRDNTYPVTPGAFTSPSPNSGGNVIVTKVNANATNLAFTTHFGGAALDAGLGLAVDAQGSVYVTGMTWSNNFPTTPGALQTQFQRQGDGREDPFSCFAAKLSPDGSRLVYSTLLGGTRHDLCSSIALDSLGNAYLGGVTASRDFPVTANSAQPRFSGVADGFLAKLNPAGSALVYSTFLGGTNWDGVASVALDLNGVLHATGCTSSGVGFPFTPNALQVRFGGAGGISTIQCGDAFLTRLSADGSRFLYSTFLGGFRDDIGIGVAASPQGDSYLTGTTNSPDFPVSPLAFIRSLRGGSEEETWNSGDAFAAKINADGSLGYSTFLGGTADDRAFSIAVDSKGQAWIAGATLSPDFHATTNAPQRTFGGRDNAFTRIPTGDGFVVQLTANGSAPLFATFIGGAGNDAAVGIAVDAKDEAYAAGFTSSLNLPTTQAAYQRTAGAGSTTFYPFNDAFVSKFGETAANPGQLPAISSLESAASGVGNGAAPGEIVAIKGTSLGPDVPVAASPSNNQFPKALAQTRVLIDGIEAPILYASATQVNAVVPYAVSGRPTVTVTVEYQTNRSAPLTVPVLAAKPALFTASGDGTGQGAILNQDNTYNSAALPAAAGTVIQIFGTGEGLVTNAPPDGFLNLGPAYPAPRLPVAVTIGGQAARILYAGAAPGAVAGLFQVNAIVPENTPPGNRAVFVTVGDSISQPGVTVAVR